MYLIVLSFLLVPLLRCQNLISFNPHVHHDRDEGEDKDDADDGVAGGEVIRHQLASI